MRRIIFTLGAVVLLSQALPALRLEVKPGTLSDNIGPLRNTTDTELVLSGSANVTDLALLRDLSRAVKTLDMSALRIVAYTYSDGDYMGRKSFSADEIPPYMLIGSGISTVKFPATVRIIGESAFAASELGQLDIPTTVETIGDNAFANCAALANVTVNKTVSFGKGVFKDCRALKNVAFGYSIAEIPEAMFDGCSSYTAALPESVTAIGDYAFRGAGLETVDLRAIESIGAFAFADMPNLSEVIIGMDEPVSVGSGAFFNNRSIADLPNWEGVLPDLALASTAGRKSLSVSFPEIGTAAFANNQAVQEVTLTETVKKIAPHAFRNLTALSQVNVTDLGTNMPEVAPESFSGLENENGRYDIILNVSKDTNDKWAEYPVWGLFDIKNMQTGVGSVAVNTVDITIARNGDVVSVDSTMPIDFVGVYSLNGMTLHESNPGVDRYEMSGIDPTTIVIVKVKSGDVVKVLKLN